MSALKDTLNLGFEFYVIDDLRKQGYHMEHFDNLNGALELFSSLDGSEGKMPTLGIQVGNGGYDLIHRLNGENVLIRDYEKGKYLSDDINSLSNEMREITQFLIDNGIVGYEYCHSVIPRNWLHTDMSVVTPIEPDFVPDSYCEDKILKAGDGVPCTAINELFITGHGWVDFKDISLNDNIMKYTDNGLIKVERVNVDYVKSDKLVGVDGQIDLSVHNFEVMADKINKPYYISVHVASYNRFERSSFAVMSFDTLPEAVKAWYEVNEKTEFTPGVRDRAAGCCVFNGCNDNLEEISYEKAAEIYGFDKIGDIDGLIADAVKTAEKSVEDVKEKGNIELEKE